MNSVFLSLGGNLGSVKKNLQGALTAIASKVGNVVAVSSCYQTKSWGKEDQPDFLNMAIEVDTSMSPLQILTDLQEIETKFGRIRREKWGSRTLDIDILFYNDEKITTNKLTIPHPLIEKRRFVLAPLAEIAPEFEHPVLKKTIKQLLVDCSDELPVLKLDFTEKVLPHE